MSSRRNRNRPAAAGDEPRLGSATDEIERGLLETLRVLAADAVVAMWEREVSELCGPRWQRKSQRPVSRAGGCAAVIQLGGRPMQLRRPRVRTGRGREIELESFRIASEQDLLTGDVLEAIVMGATIGYVAPRQDDAHVAEFVEVMSKQLATATWGRLRDVGDTLVVGEVPLHRFSALACVEIGKEGERRLLVLRAGSPASPEAVEGLVEQLMARLPPGCRPRQVIVSRPEVMGAALSAELGDSVVVRGCPVESGRHLVGMLPPSYQSVAMESLDAALRHDDPARVRDALERVAKQLEAETPAAARVVREGARNIVGWQPSPPDGARQRRRRRGATPAS